MNTMFTFFFADIKVFVSDFYSTLYMLCLWEFLCPFSIIASYIMWCCTGTFQSAFFHVSKIHIGPLFPFFFLFLLLPCFMTTWVEDAPSCTRPCTFLYQDLFRLTDLRNIWIRVLSCCESSQQPRVSHMQGNCFAWLFHARATLGPQTKSEEHGNGRRQQ